MAGQLCMRRQPMVMPSLLTSCWHREPRYLFLSCCCCHASAAMLLLSRFWRHASVAMLCCHASVAMLMLLFVHCHACVVILLLSCCVAVLLLLTACCPVLFVYALIVQLAGRVHITVQQSELCYLMGQFSGSCLRKLQALHGKGLPCDIQVDLKTSNGSTALHNAANCGHSAVVKQLLQAGAGVGQCALTGANALFNAATAGQCSALSCCCVVSRTHVSTVMLTAQMASCCLFVCCFLTSIRGMLLPVCVLFSDQPQGDAGALSVSVSDQHQGEAGAVVQP